MDYARGKASLLLVLIWGCHGALARAAQFIPLGFLPGGSQSSTASAVSYDGSTVVGVGEDSKGHATAFRWTAAAGMQALIQSNVFYGPTAVSADGSVVVGSTPYPGSSQGFRWTAATGAQLLPQPSSSFINGGANGVSGDGNVTVGAGNYNSSNAALYWVGTGSPVAMSPNTLTSAAGISYDGTAIVGTDTHYVNGAFQDQAFIQKNGVLQDLGFLSSGNRVSSATAVNSDGSVVVGTSHYTTANNDNEGFRWTASGGMVRLAGMWEPYAVNGDGTVIVGSDGVVSTGVNAMIWDPVNGMRKLKDVLTNSYGLGAVLANWQLTFATGISADGQTIAGRGVDPQNHYEAWVVVLPEPASLSVLAILGLLVCRRRFRGIAFRRS
jgi:uncharacterized membrane protein